MSVHLQVLTQTAIRGFRKCPTLYNLAYVQLYREVRVAEYLRFGTVWHVLREAWWKETDKGSSRLDAAMNMLGEIKDKPELEIDEFMLSKLIVMMKGYHERWVEFVDSVEILGVEVPFDILLVNPKTNKQSKTFRLQGQLDAVIRWKDRLWNVEEKTAAEDLKPDSPYWRRLEIDPQCSMYHNAMRTVYNEEPAGTLYFVNVKPQIRPLKKTANPKYKKGTNELYANQRAEDETADEFAVRCLESIAENPERFYQMVEVPRLEKDIYMSQNDVWQTATRIRESEADDIWIRNPDSCIHPFGTTCQFFAVCTNRASLDDVSLYRKAATAHEELAESISDTG